MTIYWNTPEQLSTTLKWVTILGIVFTAGFGTAAYFVNDRIGTLQATLISRLTGDLTSLREQAAELSIRAQNAERGVSDTYDFNGGHRRNMGGGRTSVTAGSEVAIFQTMIELHDGKNWSALRDICEDQIKSTPSWLTPYLFSGVASASLGEFMKATERLEFVVSRSGSDPNYADAPRILEQISLMLQH